MILDTSFFIHLLRERQDAFQKGVELAEEGEVQRLPTPVLMESWFGVIEHGDEEEIRKVRNALVTYPVVDVDEAVAMTAGRLLSEADQPDPADDEEIGANDAYIAAMADIYEEEVLTENVRHFEELGVPVETY